MTNVCCPLQWTWEQERTSSCRAGLPAPGRWWWWSGPERMSIYSSTVTDAPTKSTSMHRSEVGSGWGTQTVSDREMSLCSWGTSPLRTWGRTGVAFWWVEPSRRNTWRRFGWETARIQVRWEGSLWVDSVWSDYKRLYLTGRRRWWTDRGRRTHPEGRYRGRRRAEASCPGWSVGGLCRCCCCWCWLLCVQGEEILTSTASGSSCMKHQNETSRLLFQDEF